jgi:hypothetical protein
MSQYPNSLHLHFAWFELDAAGTLALATVVLLFGLYLLFLAMRRKS